MNEDWRNNYPADVNDGDIAEYLGEQDTLEESLEYDTVEEAED
jgi:hypothetical protein